MIVNDIIRAIDEQRFEEAGAILQVALMETPDSTVFTSLLAFYERRRFNRELSVAAAKGAINSRHWGQGDPNGFLTLLRRFLVPDLMHYGEFALLNRAFEIAHRQHPDCEDLVFLWKDSMLSAVYPKGIHKALMANLKHNKDSREAHYGLCFVMAHCYYHEDVTKNEKSLFPLLAERMLAKFLPAKSAQECFVVAKVYEMNSVQKMADYLSETSNESHVAGLLELQLLLLEGLQKTKQWDRVYSFSKSQLQLIDSYNYWQALNEAGIELGKVEDIEQFRTENKLSGTSNWLLAAVDLAERLGKDTKPPLVIYWTAMQEKRASADLLLDYVKKDPSILKDFESATNSSLNAKVNLAKLRYAATGEADIQALVNLYLSNKEHSDYMLASDALLIAAIESYKSCDSHNATRAVILLEHAVSKDPNHFQLRLWLVCLYRELGAMSKVEAHYNKLYLKNIQLENLGYQLATRAASTLPRKKAHMLMKKLTTTKNNELVADFAKDALDGAVYTQIKGMWDLHRRLQFSLSHGLVQLEQAKELRLNKEAVEFDDIDEIAFDTASLVDNRDFKTMYDPQGLSPWSKMLQGKEWLALNRDKELIIAALTVNAEAAVDVDSFATRVADSNELLPIEKWSANVVVSIYKRSKTKVPYPPAPQKSNTELLNYAYTLVETQMLAHTLSKGDVHLDVVPDIKAAIKAATGLARQQGQQALAVVKPWAEKLGLAGSGSLIESIVKSLLDGFKDAEAVATSALKRK